MEPQAVASQQFEADPASAGAARRFVARTLRAWGYPDALIDQAVLLANELATNAVLHARTHFELRVLRYEECLRVEVFDTNSRLPTAALVPEDSTSGRGLLLVQTVASCWGVETSGDGKVVWAELDRRPASLRLAGP